MLPFTMGLVFGVFLGVCGSFFLFLLGVALAEKDMHRPELGGYSKKLVSGMLFSPAVVGASYLFQLDKAAAVILLLICTLVIARLGGTSRALAGSLAGGVAFAVLFLPPVGSLWIERSDDRLLVALFLLCAVLGSQLVRGSKAWGIIADKS